MMAREASERIKGVVDPGKLDREIGGLHTHVSCAFHVLRIIPYIVL